MRSILLLILSLSLTARAEDYRIDPSHTYPHFAVDHLGFSLQRGRFDAVSGTIVLDREKKRGSLEVLIDAQSLSSGNEQRDRILRGSGFFDVQRFPHIRYAAKSFEWAGDAPEFIGGELTLLGVTRPVTLQIKRFKCGFHLFNFARSCGAEAAAVIRRSDFGMKSWLSAVGDEVGIELQVEAIRR